LPGTSPNPDPASGNSKKSFMNDFSEPNPLCDPSRKVRYEARLSPGEYAALKAIFAAAGCRTLSQWLKKSSIDPGQETRYVECTDCPDESSKTRMKIRLTASERQALTRRAEEEGMTPQQWLVGLVRSNLTGRPQFGMRELNALGESNYQLLAIGRNLNQIAKHLNEGLPEQVTPASLEKLRAEIRAHVDTVSKAMRGNLERWVIK
jgi:hypothetical protein